MSSGRSTAPEPSRRPGACGPPALAALSGALQFLACPPLDIWPLAFVALVPLYYAVRSRGLAAGLALGGLSGLVGLSLGYRWLPEVLTGFSELTLPESWLVTVLLNGFHAGRWALIAGLFVRLSRGSHEGAAALVAVAVAELVYPMLFPWYLGITLHTVPILLQVADLSGPVAVSMVVVSGNVLVVAAIRLASRWRGPSPSSVLSQSRALLVPASLLIGASAYGLVRISEYGNRAARADQLRVALVQSNVSPEDRQRRLKVMGVLWRQSRDVLAANDLDLLVFSEGAIPGALPEEIATREAGAFMRRLRAPALLGATLASGRGTPPELVNTALIGDGSGRICPSCRSDKQLLFPFGEYLPGEGWFPWLRGIFPNSGSFVPGPRTGPLPFRNHLLATLICFEDIHPGLVNDLVSGAPPDILISMTNDSWFRDSEAARWHFVLAKLRAVEQRRFLVRVANTGVSGVISPTGHVTLELPEATRVAAPATVRLLHGKTLFHRAGQLPLWLFAAVVWLTGRRGTRLGNRCLPHPRPLTPR